jgi:excisionase family DNA binding protein
MKTQKPKIYRRYGSAHKAAAGRPVLEIAGFFVVGQFEGFNSIRLLDGEGRQAANITLKNLDRLGNGNYAIAERPSTVNVFNDPDDSGDSGEVWISTDKAAEILNVVRSRVRQMVRAGEIGGRKKGRDWEILRVSCEALVAWKGEREKSTS